MTPLRVARVVVRAGVGVLLLLELLLGMSVLLRVLDANPDAGFADWTYRNADSLMSPFDGLFDDVELTDDTDAVLDVSTLFAMGIYAAGFVPLGMLLGWIDRSEARVEDRRQQAADKARQDRLFGRVPDESDAPVDAAPGFLARLRSRIRPSDAPESSEGGTDP